MLIVINDGDKMDNDEYKSKNINNNNNNLNKKKIIAGDKFGRLEVIERTNNRNNSDSILYKCKCRCGNIVEVTGSNLKSGNTKSCGCLRREIIQDSVNINSKKLIDKKFNKLTILDVCERRDYKGGLIYKCICDCGNICFIPINSLKDNNVKSCGCLKKIKFSKLDKDNCIDNSGIIKGIYFDKEKSKWRVEITFNKHKFRLGRFNDKKDAVKIRNEVMHNIIEPFYYKYWFIDEEKEKAYYKPPKNEKEILQTKINNFKSKLL